MKKAVIFLAEGFEEIEAITPIDLLRRAGAEVTLVSMNEGLEVAGSHGVCMKGEALFGEADYSDMDLFIIPGGMPGTLHLRENDELLELLKKACREEKLIGAICAGPTVLGRAGLLEGRNATCYPGCEDGLTGAVTSKDSVVVDGNIITSRGAGTAIPFALKLIAALYGQDKADEIKESIVYGHCKA